MAGWRLEHTYANLPSLFHTPAAPAPVEHPALAILNRPLAEQLGLDPGAIDGPVGAAIFAGNSLPEGARPIAQAYAGHQFGHFTTLGDGRAILLGEQVTPAGDRVDVQLKGPGRTTYSRRGDGRAALGPMLREYIVSEAMQALRVPTTRSLAVALTGEPVFRERVLQGAVLTRVAASHIRVGTMQWAAAHRDHAALTALSDYTRERHYPGLADADDPDRHVALFEAVADRQAGLIARWQGVGFIHGVMNTDNMALSGETIDYGPCAFMDAYDPATVFSSIDVQGRYAYGNQPGIGGWNLARLAEAMLPLFDADTSRAVERANLAIERADRQFDAMWRTIMRGKLGLLGEDAGDRQLIGDLFAWMQARAADFTNTFAALTRGDRPDAATPSDAEFDAWLVRWSSRRDAQADSRSASEELMRRSNPAVIPRNHKVEEALEAATSGLDFSALHRLLDAVATPYDHARTLPEYTAPHQPARPYPTFCGT